MDGCERASIHDVCVYACMRVCMQNVVYSPVGDRGCDARVRRHAHARPAMQTHIDLQAHANIEPGAHCIRIHIPARTHPRTHTPTHTHPCTPDTYRRVRAQPVHTPCPRHAHTMRTTNNHVHMPCTHDAQNKQSSAHAVRGRSSSCMHACIAVQYAACAADANILAPAFTSASAFTPASA